MQDSLLERRIRCPFCDAPMTVLLDISAGGQDYVEDCQVCCQPMNIRFEVHDDEILSLDVVGS